MELPLLQVNNLSIDFSTSSGIVHALQDISFSVARGEIVALVGESGSGKSVTSLSILQLLPVPPARYRSGEIFLSKDGHSQQDILKATPGNIQEIRGNDIAMIFQEPMTSLNPVFTCGEQVQEAILVHRKTSREDAKRQTIELFSRVQLPEPEGMYKRYPHQLSGGQKQRVMIALAMSCNPSLLIADEPTTALDVTVQKTILTLIKDLQEQLQIGVIFISHDLGLVAEIADRVIVMFKGRIVEQGRVKEIISQPKHAYTRSLLACRPALHPKGERLPVVSDFLSIDADGGIIEKTPPQRPATATPGSFPVTQITRPVLIRVENLSVWFAGKKNFMGKALTQVRAVDDVSFDVIENETLGLVGESGCGKTTLGRTLLRLIEPTHGKIHFKGKDLLAYSPGMLRDVRKEMQIVFQDPYSSLNPRMLIGHAIQQPLQIHGYGRNERERKERVIAMLEKVDLKADHYNRYPHEFSGGQRQRIVIARALIMNPSFVICDESVSALDVSVQAQVLNLLSDLKKEFGFTIIFISHDLSVVRYISDRIMVMNKGKIEEIGSADQVYYAPQMAYTKKLIQSIPKM